MTIKKTLDYTFQYSPHIYEMLLEKHFSEKKVAPKQIRCLHNSKHFLESNSKVY